jgi:UDP-glucose 4-epimerase
MSEAKHTIFVTGGAGYIGSHFLEYWYRTAAEHMDPCRIVVLDNMSGGHFEILDILNLEIRKNYHITPIFEKIDLCDLTALKNAFSLYRPHAVVHFAGKISVAESVVNPELYFRNNVEGSENLLFAMKEYNCKKIVFSSTAAVYGNVESSDPIDEEARLEPVNPYGDTKLRIEQVIKEASLSWGLKGIIFRYFNAAGAAVSGTIGEWHEPETHLIPLVLEKALNPDAELKVFGNDYPTRDGTCIRDYIHVTDLAHAHLLGIKRLLNEEVSGTEIYNLGTQNGTSVLEIINAVKNVTKKEVKVVESDRRPGDAAILIASPKKVQKVLGWQAVHSDIETILKTAYNWHQNLLRIKQKS